MTAADVAGVRPRQVYRWPQNDPAFKALYEQCRVEACDRILGETHRRGVKGWLEPVYQGGKRVGVIRKYSDACLMSLLKARLPAFRNRREISKDDRPIFSDPDKMSDAELRVQFELAAKALGYVIVRAPVAVEIDEKSAR